MLISDVYVDLSNQDQPFQEFSILQPVLSQEIEVQLSLNEVTLQDGQIGFFEP